MPSFDSIRQQAPWMQDWSDEEVMLKLSELTGTSVRDVARDFGIKIDDKRNPISAGISAGIDELQGLGYSGAAAVADVVGAKGAKDWLERQTLANQVQSELAGRPDLERIEEQNLGSALPYAGYQVAKQIPNLVGSLAAGALVPEVAIPAALTRGAAMLPRALGGGGLGGRVAAAGTEAGAEYAARRAALETGQSFAKQVVGGAAFNEAQATGSLYQAAREGGDENAGAKALLGSVPYALTETLPEAMLVGRFKGGSGFTGNILTRMGKSAGVQSLSGATSEGLQNEMEMALNPNLTADQQFSNRLNSIAAGGLVEGLLGGLGGMSKGGRLPSGGSFITGANASDQPTTPQTPDDRGTNTAIDSGSNTPSILQSTEIDQQKLAQFVPPTSQTPVNVQTEQQLAQAKAEAEQVAQQQAQMQAQQQQEQRTAALQAFGVTQEAGPTQVGNFMGNPVYGTDRINAIADALNAVLPQVPEHKVQVARALMAANAATGGKMLKVKFDGSNVQKSVLRGFDAIDKLEQKLQIDQVDDVAQAAEILNGLSMQAKGTQLEEINAVYEAITGQSTDGYKQSQGDTNGTLQTTTGLGTIPKQGGASQADGGELGLLRPEQVQSVGAGSQSVGSPAVETNVGREAGVRAGASVSPTTSVPSVAAPSQVTEIPRGQIAQQTKPVAGAVKGTGGAGNAVDGKASGKNVALSPEQAEAVLKDVPKLLRSILGNVFRSAKKVEFLATFQKQGHYETHEEVGERLGLKKSTVKDYAKLLAVDEASGLPKFIAENLDAFRRAFAAEARKLGVTPEQVMQAISTVNEVEETQELGVSEREIAESGLAVQEYKYRTDTEGKKTNKVDRTNVSDLAEEGNTAEALSNQYVKLAEAQQAAEDSGNAEEAALLQAQMDEVTGKIAALSKRRTKAKAKQTEETEDAVQEPSAEEVPLRKRAGSGELLRQKVTGKRKAAKEVVKVEAKPEEKVSELVVEPSVKSVEKLPKRGVFYIAPGTNKQLQLYYYHHIDGSEHIRALSNDTDKANALALELATKLNTENQKLYHSAEVYKLDRALEARAKPKAATANSIKNASNLELIEMWEEGQRGKSSKAIAASTTSEMKARGLLSYAPNARKQIKWNAIAEQYGLPTFESLPPGAQADALGIKGELTLAKANEIYESNQKQFEKGLAPAVTHSIVDAEQTDAEDVASRFPAVQAVMDRFDDMGIGRSVESATVWATTTDDTFMSDGVYEVLPGGWQGIMFHEDSITPEIDPDAELNIAHELAHAIDMAGHGGVYSHQIELMVSAKDGKIRPIGVVMQEMYDLYQKNEGWKQYLEYPFDHMAYPKLANNAERIRTELFAQLFSAYTNPTLREAMRLTAPVTYKFMTEVFENVRNTKSFLGKTQTAAANRRQAFANRNAEGGAQARQADGDGGEVTPAGQSYDKISRQTSNWVGQSKGFIDSLPTWSRGPVRAIHNVLFNTKETALGLMITEDIAALAKKYIPSITKYIEVQHQRNSMVADKERRLTSIKTHFEDLDTNTRRAVNDIIASSTVNGKWAFDPQIQGVTTNVDEALNARFKALPKNAQTVVREVFAVGRDSLVEKKDTIRKIIDDEFNERSAAAETEQEKADVARRKSAMEKQFAGILNINPTTPYAPLKRFGPFVVVAKSPAYLDAEAANDTKALEAMRSDESHYIVEFAETAGDAEQIYDDLNALGKFKVDAPFKKSTARDSLYRGTDLYKGFAKLKRVLAAEKGVEKSLKTKDAELLERLETMVNDLYLLSLADSSARKTEMQRKKISGFNRDMMRAFFTQGMADAHYIANLKTSDASMDTMVQMQKEAGENRAEAYPYMNEVMAREAQSLEIREPSLGDAMNRMAGDWFLTFSPSFYFQQMTQTYVLSLPWLAGKYNYFKSARALQQAYKQILPLIKGTGLKEHMDFSGAPADVQEMLKILVGRGRIDIGVEAELGGFRSEAENLLAQKYNNATNRMRGAINRIEALNRSVAAIAAYRLEMQKSGDKAKAIEAADKVVHITHGSYDGFNTPRLFNKSAVTRSLTQFRRFQIIQLSMLARMVHNAFKGADKTERAMGRKQLAFLLGHTFALGGVKGMPIYVPAALAYSVINGAFGDEDDPEDFEAWLRSKGGLLLARGIPANMGVDLSGKLGMGNVLSVLPYTDVDLTSKQGYANLLLGASGPFLGGLVPKMLDGVNLVAGGDYYRGLEQMLPNGLNNGMKVLRFNTEGITMRNGDVVMSPEDIGFADNVFQLAGLPTTTMTERQYLQGEVIKYDQFYNDRTKELKHDYTKAYKNNDSAAMAEARGAWTDLQESRVKNGYARKPLSDLLKAPRQQAKREQGVVSGVETTKSNKAFVQRLTEE